MKLKHPNYLLGIVAWILALATVILVPKLGLFKKSCKSCDEYSRFVDSLSSEQKLKLSNLEAGVINIGNKYYCLEENLQVEYEAYKKNSILYKKLDPITDEKTRRLIILNSLMKTMPPEERNLLLEKKAVIVFRDNQVLLIQANNGVNRY